MGNVVKRWRNSPLFGAALVFVTIHAVADARQEKGNLIKQEIGQIWSSIQSIRFTSVEFDVDAHDVEIPNQPRIQYDILMDASGRRIVKADLIRSNGEVVPLEQLHEDGQRHRELHTVPGRPDVIDRLVVRNQVGPVAQYRGTMNSVLWILLPEGNSLHAHLDSDALFDAGSEGKPASLTVMHKGGPIRLTLDPAHDWLPSRMEGRSGEWVIRVARFDHKGGHWFPVEGIQIDPGNQGTSIRRGFRVLDFEINGEPDEASLKTPFPQKGTFVQDAIRGKSFFSGGLKAREEFEKKYNPPLRMVRSAPTTSPPEQQPIVAQDPSPMTTWQWVGAGGSIACLGVAVLIGTRRYLRR